MIINDEYMVNYPFKVKNHAGYIHVSTMLKNIIMSEPISKRFGKYNSVRQNRSEYAQAMKEMSICS